MSHHHNTTREVDHNLSLYIPTDVNNEMTTPRTPFFSIIINIYNGEKYLAEALASVFGQKFNDWELILWDDHSIDNSAEICRTLNDRRVRYFYSQEQIPLGPARNLAIKKARGKWLAFLDQDDIWSPGKLRDQYKLITEDTTGKLGIVYGRTVKFDHRGLQRNFDHWYEFCSLPEGNILQELISNPCFIAFSSALLRKSAIDDIGGIPTDILYCPDYYLFIMLAKHYRAACLQETCCNYRLHESNLSRSVSIHANEEAINIISKIEKDFDASFYRRRISVHKTCIGFEKIMSGKAIVEGISLIMMEGSLPYLLSRPVVRLFRAMRRALLNRTKAQNIFCKK